MTNTFIKGDFPSLVMVATYRVHHEKLTRSGLATLTDKVREAIGMKALSPMIIDSLSVPDFGTDALSVNQPLMTSIMSLDSWPEIKVSGVTGGFVILIHSCKRFHWRDVHQAIKAHFPEAELLRKDFRDNTCRGLSYAVVRLKLWFIDRFRRSLRNCEDVKEAKATIEVA